MCPNKECMNTSQFELKEELSIYADWQKIRIQELIKNCESGYIPRSIDVILRNECVDIAQPGETVIVTGVLIVISFSYSNRQFGEKYKLIKYSNLKKNNIDDNLTKISYSKKQDLNFQFAFLTNNIQIISEKSKLILIIHNKFR